MNLSYEIVLPLLGMLRERTHPPAGQLLTERREPSQHDSAKEVGS